MSICPPRASRARISETMNVSEKRGYILSTYPIRWPVPGPSVVAPVVGGEVRSSGDMIGLQYRGGLEQDSGEIGQPGQPLQVEPLPWAASARHAVRCPGLQV